MNPTNIQVSINNIVPLSIVVPTMNNKQELIDTLESIVKFCPLSAQIIIIDGGINKEDTQGIAKNIINRSHSLVFLEDKARGVYHAQNKGIKACIGEWIMILNSGDELNSSAKEILTKEFLFEYDNLQLLVFSQIAYSKTDKFQYYFSPTKTSVWPHQSILVKKEVYDKYGYYREDFVSGSDQYYFAIIRKEVRFLIIDKFLTIFKLGGISSKVNLRHSYEIFSIKRKLGNNYIYSFILSYIFPFIRLIIEKIFGKKFLYSIKTNFFEYYR